MKSRPPYESRQPDQRRTDSTNSIVHLAKRKTSGFALAETVVGMSLMSVTLGAVFAMNACLLGILKQGKESAFATELIQERVEQFRTGQWSQFTDPAKLQYAIGRSTTSATNLPTATEIVKVQPRDNPNLVITYTRSPSGTVSPAVVAGPVLIGENSVKVTVEVQWTSRGRTRSRSMVTVLSQGGIISL